MMSIQGLEQAQVGVYQAVHDFRKLIKENGNNKKKYYIINYF